MSYCAETDLYLRYPAAKLDELADLDGDGEADDGVIDKARADADAACDGYIQGHYPVPLDPVPAIIAICAADIAVYNLFSGHGIDEETADKIVIDRYKQAISFLRDVAAGNVSLTPAGAPGAAVVKTRPKDFGPATTRKF
jgi:phage gp36-like protein